LTFLINLYARFFERYRWCVAVFAVAMTIVCAASMVKLQTNDNIYSLFTERRSAKSASEKASVRANDRIIAIVLQGDDLLTSRGLAAIHDLHDSLSKLDDVDSVTSVYDIRRGRRVGRRRTYPRLFPPPDADPGRIEKAKELALEHPMVVDQLLTKDGRATQLIVELPPDKITTTDLRPIVESIQQLVSDRISQEEFRFDITGPAVLQVTATDSVVRDQLVFNIAGPVVAVIIAFILFRRLAAVLIVTTGPILGVVWTLGYFSLSGEQINPINGAVAPLALTIGLADSVHMMLHIRAGVQAGASPREAAAEAIRHVGAACLLTSLTTAIGFGSLAIADLYVLQRFGICCSAAVIAAFLAVVTVVPLLGSTFLGRYTVRPSDAADDVAATDTELRWHGRVVQYVIQRRVAVLVASILITALMIWSASRQRVNIVLARSLPTGSEASRSFQFVDERFGSLPVMISVEWSTEDPPAPGTVLNVIGKAHKALAAAPNVSPPLSLVTLFDQFPSKNPTAELFMKELDKIPDERLDLFFNEDTGQSFILARFQDVGSNKLENALVDVESKLGGISKEHPEFRFVLPESLPVLLRIANRAGTDLLLSLFLAVPITTLVIGLALRSLRLGLVSLLPNLFPMAALAATIYVMEIRLTLIVLTVFTMCFGIAVDDTIHALTAFKRQFQRGASAKESTVRAYIEIGNALVLTTVILIAGLSVLMLGQAEGIRTFGGLFVVGLVWAFVGDLVILPALLTCFPPRLGKIK